MKTFDTYIPVQVTSSGIYDGAAVLGSVLFVAVFVAANAYRYVVRYGGHNKNDLKSSHTHAAPAGC